jgi:hypothetical protein
MFQLTAARRRLVGNTSPTVLTSVMLFQLTAARRRLVGGADWEIQHLPRLGFNSQPPEGGWIRA